MKYEELVVELGKARKLYNGFQSKVLAIIQYIKDKVDQPLNVIGWNRLGYYDKTLLCDLQFDEANYHQYRIFECDIHSKKDNTTIGKIALDILQIMQLEYKTTDGVCNPVLVFMFTFQKADVIGWPSWPDPRDEDWIKKTFENKDMYISSNPVNSKDSIFIANIVPIGNLTSEKLIENELQKLNELYAETVEEKCGCKIKSVFNVE